MKNNAQGLKIWSSVASGIVVVNIFACGNAMVDTSKFNCGKYVTVEEQGNDEVSQGYMSDRGIVFDYGYYNTNSNDTVGGQYMNFDEEKLKTYSKLEDIAALENNWNENGAKPFPKTFINKLSDVLMNMDIQPEVFPTALGTIQLEYDKDDGDYLEIEVKESFEAEVYRLDPEDNETFDRILISQETLGKVVEEFYG